MLVNGHGSVTLTPGVLVGDDHVSVMVEGHQANIELQHVPGIAPNVPITVNADAIFATRFSMRADQ